MSQTLQSPQMQALLRAQDDRMRERPASLSKALTVMAAIGAIWWALS